VRLPVAVERFDHRLWPFVQGAHVVDQSDGYFIEPGIRHNGKLVLGESIGDLAGTRIAWRAFQKALAARPEPSREGFMAFFIAWGQWRGDEIRPETQRPMVRKQRCEVW